MNTINLILDGSQLSLIMIISYICRNLELKILKRSIVVVIGYYKFKTDSTENPWTLLGAIITKIRKWQILHFVWWLEGRFCFQKNLILLFEGQLIFESKSFFFNLNNYESISYEVSQFLFNFFFNKKKR